MKRAWAIVAITSAVAVLAFYPGAKQPTRAVSDDAANVLVTVGNIGERRVDVFVKNVGVVRLKTVFLECTLRDEAGLRIDSVPVLVSNLAPGDSQKEEAWTTQRTKIAKVECRAELITD